MSGSRFSAARAEGSARAELEALVPANPYATANFFEARRRGRTVTWVLGLRDDAGRLECGCAAFIRPGRLNRTLEIPSLPAVDAQSPFWSGLREFCRHHGVTTLELDTYGSPPGVEIPHLGAHCVRRGRCEFVVDLAGDLSAMLSSNHKRNVKRAKKAGLTVRRTRSEDAASAHRTLMSQSMDRRRSRGEDVVAIGPLPDDIAFLRSGSGELFQAIHEEAVLSSVLVLRASKGGYYQSAGTSSEGMAVGASHFLIHGIASQLSADGAQIFNLGGADEQSSLARFKEGFGAALVALPSASCNVGPSWRRLLSRAYVLVRSDRKALRRLLIGDLSRQIVYAGDTGAISPPDVVPGLEFRMLTPDDLGALSVEDAGFRARQLERLHRFGASYAYAVFADGQIAHVSWLLPPSAIEKDAPRVLRARPDEAEITCCETLPEFRGRGIYSVAIRNLVAVARGQGIRRVFMKTAADNTASQSGIEKAALVRVGSATLIVLPLLQRLVIWRRVR